MPARVVRHPDGAVSIEPAQESLEARAVAIVLDIFGPGVVEISGPDLDEAKARHPSAGPRPAPLHSVA
jgi:hypothetical protein